MNKLFTILLLIGVLIFPLSKLTAQNGFVIYVDDAVSSPASGTESSPTTLADALNAASSGTIIKMDQGTYTLDNPLYLKSDITLEGGFDRTSSWTKSSNKGLTTIHRSANNIEDSGADNARVVAIYAVGKSNFRLQDLTISTDDAPAATDTNPLGTSTYGVHLDNCSNYNIVRCCISAGRGGNGYGRPDANVSANYPTWDGQDGGAGGAGTNGEGGSSSTGFGDGGAGGTGGIGGLGGANAIFIGGTTAGTGGNGGNGGRGADAFGTTNISSGTSGTSGTVSSGGNGGTIGSSDSNNNNTPAASNGNGVANISPASAGNSLSGSYNMYYKSVKSDDGNSGDSGGGGGGGGAGVDTGGVDASGGGGGGGSGGGGGGGAGAGAYGGGAAFSLFIWNSATGNIIDSNLGTPTGGTGGIGGFGGTGGAPGSIGLGTDCTNGSTDCNKGGNGGEGAKGGNGGNGGNGADGPASAIFVNGTAPTYTSNGNAETLTAGANTPTAFDLAGQTTITVQNIASINTPIQFTGGASFWAFTPADTSPTPTGTFITTTFPTIGRRDVTNGSNTYSGFHNIIATITTPSGLTVMNLTETTADLSWTENGGVTTWNIEYGTNGYTQGTGTLVSSVTSNPYYLTGLTSGISYDYYVQAVSNGTNSTWAGPYNFTTCNLSAILTSTNTTCQSCSDGTISSNIIGGLAPYNYLWSDGQTTASISNLLRGDYTVTITDANSCSTIATTTVAGSELEVIMSNNNNVSCNGEDDGTASITVSGGVGSYTYIWSNGQTTATAINLTADIYTVTVTDANASTTSSSIDITEPANLGVALANSSVSCNGGNNGTALVAVFGGTPPYAYSWSNGQTTPTSTALIIGDYTVTVTDFNGCTATGMTTITQPTALNTYMSSTNTSCNGGNDGTVSVITSGGVGGYTYSWSNGQATATATAVAGGSHTVTVTDANSCTVTGTVTVSQPPPLNISTTTTPTACNGGTTGTATATPTNGIPPYTYLWSDGTAQTTSIATNLGSGIYFATITDNAGCTAVAQATVTNPSSISAAITSVSQVTCNGYNNGSATVTGNGGVAPSGYSYQWNNSAGSTISTTNTVSNLAAGTYFVTVVDDNNCAAFTQVTITEPLPLTVSIPSGLTQQPVCNGTFNGTATAVVAGGTTPYSYQWANGETGITATVGAGAYTVTITDARGCDASSSTTIEEPSPLTASISPNFINHVTCNGGNDGSALVTTVSGGVGAYTYAWNNGQTTASASNLTVGSYTVTITDGNTCTTTINALINEPTILTATVSKTDITCDGGNDGSAFVTTVSGGVGAYTYTWNNGQNTASASSLAVGDYTVTITDTNACTTSASVTIEGNIGPSTLIGTDIQTAINTLSGYAEHPLGAGELIHFYDQSTGNIMCTIDNSASSHDYGCTKVEIDRAGTVAAEFVNPNANSYMFSKSLKITPTTNTSSDPNGYTITLYYSDAEMTGWEAATGQSRNDVQLHKVDGDNHVYDVTAGNPSNLSITSGTSTTYAAFGSGHSFSASFNNGFSGFGAGVGSSPLPVELVDFQARKDNKTSLLTWQTASEENNKGFHIEHSNNGKDFDAIGWIDGNGNTATVQKYRFVHKKPDTGVNYYRLAQEDFDGTTSRSDVRTVLFNADLGITVYPNPSKLKGSTNIQFISNNAQQVNISVFEMDGKQIMSMNHAINEGDNILPLPHNLLNNGIYIISITHDGGTKNVKLSIVE